MSVLPIRIFPDPVLRERAQEVPEITATHRRLVDDMVETMRDAPGVGLAAPQVGVLERIFVWEVEDTWGVVVNPTIVARSEDVVEEEEGCLSLPGLAYDVVRTAQVRVEGLNLDGNNLSFEADGLLARVCQHEIDHLDGVLFIDRLQPASRREALAILREEALGLPVRPGAPTVPPEETF
ncbi:MAG: peptide deformylase [Actinomycetota bacterium]|nr:peptide deformylase [Actinomycetota bacterium]